MHSKLFTIILRILFLETRAEIFGMKLNACDVQRFHVVMLLMDLRVLLEIFLTSFLLNIMTDIHMFHLNMTEWLAFGKKSMN